MSRFLFFLIIITKIEKFIGIAKATRLPSNEPDEIESPTIITIPLIAKKIEYDPIRYLLLHLKLE